MADDPAFLFYPGDYLRDTQCLSESVQVAYDRIICEHMRNICISQQQLNFFTKRLTLDEKSELMQVLLKVNGGFQIKWVADSILKRREYSESRRKNRKGKGENNTPKANNISKSYVPHMENANEIENESVIGSGVENFDERFKNAFDENTMDAYKLPYRNIDLTTELKKFRVKCDNDKGKYYQRGTGGLRAGFQYHLDKIRDKSNGKSDQRKADAVIESGKDFGSFS